MNHKKIVMIQSTLGHYHYPRLSALARYCQTEGFVFNNIELSGSEGAYPWFQTHTQDNFSNYCLFPDDQLEKISKAKLWTSLKRQLEVVDPDVVFILGYSLGVMRKLQSWCEKRRIATVLISDSNEFDKKRSALLEFLKHFIVRRFDAAFVAGQSSSAYIQKLGISSKRVAFGCDVVDVQTISRQAERNRQRIDQIREQWNLPSNYFLFVGRLIPEKNVPGLVVAFEKFLKSDQCHCDWHLVICGSGAEVNRINSFLQSLPSEYQGKFHLYGFVEPDRIIDFFSAASYFILPSVSETWGLAVNEAMACGLPVIVSQKAGSSFDLVRNGENGWIINPFDTEQMAKVLAEASNVDESVRQNFGRRSRSLIDDWDLDRFSHGIIESTRMALLHAEERYHG